MTPLEGLPDKFDRMNRIDRRCWISSLTIMYNEKNSLVFNAIILKITNNSQTDGA